MKGIDLLPKGLPKRPRTSARRIGFVGSSLSFLLVAVLLYVGKSQELADLRGALKAQEEDYSRYAWLDRDIAATQEKVDEALAKLAAAERQIEAGLPAGEILSGLPRFLPAGVRLVHFSLESSGTAVIEGEAISLEAVASLVLALENADLFDSAWLVRTGKAGEDPGLFAFQVRAMLSEPGGETQ